MTDSPRPTAESPKSARSDVPQTETGRELWRMFTQGPDRASAATQASLAHFIALIEAEAAALSDSAYARLVVDGTDVDRDRYMDDPVYHGIVERIRQAALSDSAWKADALYWNAKYVAALSDLARLREAPDGLRASLDSALGIRREVGDKNAAAGWSQVAYVRDQLLALLAQPTPADKPSLDALTPERLAEALIAPLEKRRVQFYGKPPPRPDVVMVAEEVLAALTKP